MRLEHKRVLSYPLDQVWPVAIRYLRVDQSYEVVDRDLETGYILFDFPVGERKGRGSIELLATTDPSGRASVKLQVATQTGPAHLPNTIADGIAKKVRAEQGQPAPPPPTQPEPPKKPEPNPNAPDAGPAPLIDPGQQ